MSEASAASRAVLDRIRIVLVETSHTGNIGAAARAMKTMGLKHLYLVKPRQVPDEQAVARASGAADVLAAHRLCANLDDALAGTSLAIAFTARSRELSQPHLSVREAALQAVSEARADNVALVFGAETSGLANEDVLKCHRIAHIPASEDYSSLNLAAAVQVACYELRVAAGLDQLPAAPEHPMARHEEVERLMQHLEQTLTEVGFLNPDHPKRLMVRMRRLFARTRVEREEAQLLRGIFRMISRATRHTRTPGG